MLTGWDYTVIGIYLAFMMGIGFLWSRINKNASDFFRGGNKKGVFTRERQPKMVAHHL